MKRYFSFVNQTGIIRDNGTLGLKACDYRLELSFPATSTKCEHTSFKALRNLSIGRFKDLGIELSVLID